MNEPLLIDRADALGAFVATARDAPWLGLDTEFVRDRSYFPKAGLIQVATPETIALVDPVALDDLSPLARLLGDSQAVKILHSSRQDLELFVHLFGSVPAPLFDTQVAATLVGCATQIGYATLVAELLGRSTGTALGRYAWLRRPLEPVALAYAAADVAHLGELRALLERRLHEAALAVTFGETMGRLADAALYLPNPAAAWRKVRAARRLSGEALLRLKALAAWRESEAMHQDRPRQWVVPDAALVAIARRAPRGGAALASIRTLDRTTLRRYRGAITRVLSELSAGQGASGDT